MHTIKLLLTYYLNISVQAANLSDCRIEKIDSVARIESNRIETFFARIGMLYFYVYWQRGNGMISCLHSALCIVPLM